MKSLVLTFFTLILVIPAGLFGQATDITLTGQVVDPASGTPVEFATVMVGDRNNRQAITGTTTDADGRFTVATDRQNIFLEISFIGYDKLTIEEIPAGQKVVDLGTLSLASQSAMLDEVTVRAEKSSTEFKLDRRVFNVGKDLSSTGASALEVLNNVPSVNVSIEGDISLRGSTGVQVLINGKPSVIASEQGNALGTLTADMIESVEVITNPSAKYDAEGTSGIINIVLKKEERKGMNGSMTLNVGAPHNHSLGLSLNRRTEKFNLFSQLGAGYRELPNDTRSINRDLTTGNVLFSEGEEFRNEQFYNFVLGTDYYIDERNVITLSGNFAYEVEDQPSSTEFRLEDVNGDEISRWARSETTEATNPKWQYELNYKRDFKDDKDHDLVFSILGRYFGKDQTSAFLNTTIEGQDRDGEQQTRTDFLEAENTFKLDYTRPFDDKWTLETGAQYVIKDVSNDFAVRNLENGVFVDNPDLTNVFNWNQNVLALYGTGAYEFGKWGLKLGMRVENTDLRTLLETTGESNNQNFTDLFPSAHSSYKINEGFSVQAGYSRRIFRPRLWDLNPFFNIRNDFNIRVGNPDLQPEYTDSYELTSIFIFGEASLNAGVYHRYTTDVVERVSSFANNVNTVMPMNIGTNASTGLEVNGKYSPGKKVSFMGDFNFNFFQRVGELEGQSFDFSADQWSGRITAKMKLPADLEVEVTGQYQSAFQTVQSTVSDQLFADMGVRKKLLKGRGALNLSVRDVFVSRIQESQIIQEDFTIYNRRFRGRFITLGFSFGFGKGEAMEFSAQKRHF
ncbi:TonB-dependent receptor [Lewinella sp. W8]|uniref:TonB-dependent receptor domain-containing protein n=1 Tax=Lewinella sp. W8 TaxID=2528208 RepID=UPI00106744DA|nr:TonB-dependent receptor [Lewinella sp. W8]MTB50096.1 TonB-dependent receptor [Lewinella sp. W8]